jgi:hypothetical protein
MEGKEDFLYAIKLADPTKEELSFMIDRVRVLLSYRAQMAKQILEQLEKEKQDEELLQLLYHMYDHYSVLIKSSLGLK